MKNPRPQALLSIIIKTKHLLRIYNFFPFVFSCDTLRVSWGAICFLNHPKTENIYIYPGSLITPKKSEQVFTMLGLGKWIYDFANQLKGTFTLGVRDSKVKSPTSMLAT